jgi:hypothetical protein
MSLRQSAEVMPSFRKQSIKFALALIEIAIVSGLAIAVASGLRAIPSVTKALAPLGEATAALVVQWLPLVVIALLADWLFRRRGLDAWGLKLVDGSVRETVRISVYMLVLGGFVPLVLAVLAGDSEPLRATVLEQSSAVLGPVLAQELFLLGYAQRRLRDEMPGLLTVFPITAAFLLAHLANLEWGESGVLFLAAIAWQGLVWSSARAALDSIVPQIAAHAALLLLFIYPLPAAVAVGIAGLIVMSTMAHWARRKLKELRMAVRPRPQPAKT